MTQQEVKGQTKHHRHADHKEGVDTGLIRTDVHHSERWPNTHLVITKHSGCQAYEQEAESPGRKNGFNDSAVQVPDDQALDDHAYDGNAQGGHYKHCHPKIYPCPHGKDKCEPSQHEKLAMSKLDHPHHAKDNCQPHADEKQAGNGVHDFYAGEQRKIHADSLDRFNWMGSKASPAGGGALLPHPRAVNRPDSGTQRFMLRTLQLLSPWLTGSTCFQLSSTSKRLLRTSARYMSIVQ